MRRLKMALAGALVALTVTGTTAHAQDALFTMLSAAPTSATPVATGADVIANRFARLSATSLAATLAPPVADTAPSAERLAKAKALPLTVSVTVAPGLTATFRRLHVDAPDEGGFEWHGTLVSGARFGSAVLLLNNGRVLGQVQIGGRTFRITPLTGELHRISEHAPGKLPGDIVVPAPGNRSEAAAPDTEATPPASIDVLMVYTKRSRDAAVLAGTSVADESRLAISLANSAYIASGARVRVRLRAMRYAGATYDELARPSYNQLLDDLSTGAMFAGIRTARTTVGADLVSLMHERTEFCGVAWLVENPSAATKSLGFSVFTRTCISNLSFAHELGHNIGLRHDRFVDSSAGLGYNFGHVNLTARVRSVMAYNNHCTFSGFNCTRVNMFSTPTRLYNGVTTLGSAANNNTRTLNRNAAAIAAYLTPAADAPAPTAALAD